MKTLCKSAASAALLLALSSSGAMAAVFNLNTADPTNGVTRIYSTTFDGGLAACSGGSVQPNCTFFGGDPPGGHVAPYPGAIALVPNPTGVNSTGVLAVSPSDIGSYLDLTLGGGNTNVALNAGAVSLPALSLVIGGATTVTTAPGAGWVFRAPFSGPVAISGSGAATIQWSNSPGLAADFSTLGGVVTGCTGPLCSLLGALSLDMVRYQLDLQFDPTFTSFTGKFEGQTSNGSLIFANLNSVPVPAAGWLMLSGIGALAGLRRKKA